MSNVDETLGNVNSFALPTDDKRAARREWVKRSPWFGAVTSYVAERARYAAEREAAATSAPERRRGWVAGNDRLLAMLAVLAAWQDWQGDEHGTRRAVPASVEMLADVLTALGFADGIKGETLDAYVAEWLEYLRRSGRLKLVRESKRVTRDTRDPDAREYLTYFGREIVEHEPHAEPLCWKRPKIAEQPRPDREPRESTKEAAKLAPTNPNEPTPAAVRFKAEDAAECAQVKFESHGANPKARNERRAPSRVSTCGTHTAPAGQTRGSPGEWLQAIAAGRMSLHDAIRRGFMRG